MTLRAVLFDLDNTLVHFSERRFFDSYLPLVSAAFSDIMPSDVFVTRLLLSTQALINNDGSTSNVDYFMKTFAAGYEDRRHEIWDRFMAFYDGEEYGSLASLMSAPRGSRETFDCLRRHGARIVIASNPIWPRKAQLKRLSWAGLGDQSFDFIASMENMSRCKPHIEFYMEVCAKIGEGPEACLMVGNDPVNDMIVGRTGMKTFLVNDGGGDSGLELSRGFRPGNVADIPTPDFSGPLAWVPAAVEALLGGGAGDDARPL